MNTINPNYVPNSFYGANNELQVGKPLAEAVQADVKAHLDSIPDPVADQLFLKAIADLSPEAVDTAGERQELFAKFSEAAQKLASIGSPGTSGLSGTGAGAMPYTGDIAKFLARAMIEFAGQQRQQAVEDRVLARQAAQAEMLNQAFQQETAANQMMAGAVANAVLGGIGGALSNALDRLLYGAVADFFHFHTGTWSFYIFNLADVAITAGVLLLFADLFGLGRKSVKKPA